MKYKVGDRFIIEIDGMLDAKLYSIKGFNSLVFDDFGLDRLEKIPDDAPEPPVSAAEIWEIARLISLPESQGGIPLTTIKDIFDAGISNVFNLDCQTVAEKYRTWKERPAEKPFCVGDIVRHVARRGYTGAIVHIEHDGYCCVLRNNGDVFTAHKDSLRYTGKSVNVKMMLDLIGGCGRCV